MLRTEKTIQNSSNFSHLFFWCSCNLEFFCHPYDTMWIRDIGVAQGIDDMRTSHSITEKHYPNFWMLDPKILTAMKKILENFNFKKKVFFFEEQRAQTNDRFLRGRQIAQMIYEHFQVTCTSETILEFFDIMNVTLRGDDVQGFYTK